MTENEILTAQREIFQKIQGLRKEIDERTRRIAGLYQETLTLSDRLAPSKRQEFIMMSADHVLGTKCVRLYGGSPTWDGFVQDIKQVMDMTGCGVQQAKNALDSLALRRICK